jgi:hypothetical protein
VRLREPDLRPQRLQKAPESLQKASESRQEASRRLQKAARTPLKGSRRLKLPKFKSYESCKLFGHSPLIFIAHL